MRSILIYFLFVSTLWADNADYLETERLKSQMAEIALSTSNFSKEVHIKMQDIDSSYSYLKPTKKESLEKLRDANVELFSNVFTLIRSAKEYSALSEDQLLNKLQEEIGIEIQNKNKSQRSKKLTSEQLAKETESELNSRLSKLEFLSKNLDIMPDAIKTLDENQLRYLIKLGTYGMGSAFEQTPLYESFMQQIAALQRKTPPPRGHPTGKSESHDTHHSDHSPAKK